MDIYSLLSSKSHNLHYLKRYIKFIEYCKSINENDTSSIFETHHILPKAKDLFPQYKSLTKFPWNKINLTLRQHFIAHLMLWKTFRGSQAQAFKLMCVRIQSTKSKHYALVKSDVSLSMCGSNNCNSDGKFSKLQWQNASDDRRRNQSELMVNYNKKYKSKPREIRTYICEYCQSPFLREEFCHHQLLLHPTCSILCRNRRIAKIKREK